MLHQAWWQNGAASHVLVQQRSPRGCAAPAESPVDCAPTRTVVHAAWRTSGCNSGNDFDFGREAGAMLSAPCPGASYFCICSDGDATYASITINDTSVREHPAALNKCTIPRSITAGVSCPQALCPDHLDPSIRINICRVSRFQLVA